MDNIANGFYAFSQLIARYTYISILWVLFTLMGLILFGVTPATVGMFAVVRKWVQKDRDIPIFKTYWEEYKKNFVKANILGLILMAAGYFISIEYLVLRTQTGSMYFMANIFVIAQMVFYLIILLYFFPIYAHFNIEKLIDYFKWPFIIGIIHPILTVLLIVVTSIILFVSYLFLPTPLNVLGLSVSAYIISYGASFTFGKYEDDKEVNNDRYSNAVSNE
ncbi:MAG TPA: YesL family protein [Pseudogracilibacillus sp.]|nr:YesL family protein [Pseudogracilibacillus sp.]